jgi:phosphoglycolate phosphatase
VLILFDIDMTLLSTDGAGADALADAGRALHGDHFRTDTIEYHGRIDPLILEDLLRVNGVEPTPDAATALRAGYAERLPERLAGRSRALPGVHELLDLLAEEASLTLGVLTGNFAETGRLKLEASGLDPERFEVCVWGDDSPHTPPAREHLPPVALDRYAGLDRGPARPERAVIIGDTVHDVACARATGLRSLGVATGSTPERHLQDAGATRVVPDLTRTEEIARWLTTTP